MRATAASLARTALILAIVAVLAFVAFWAGWMHIFGAIAVVLAVESRRRVGSYGGLPVLAWPLAASPLLSAPSRASSADGHTFKAAASLGATSFAGRSSFGRPASSAAATVRPTAVTTHARPFPYAAASRPTPRVATIPPACMARDSTDNIVVRTDEPTRPCRIANTGRPPAPMNA